MRQLLVCSTAMVALSTIPALAQPCAVPGPAAAAGYTVKTFGGSPTIGQNWLLSSPSGTGTHQNADGVTIANPTNNGWNGQLQTWNNGQGAAFGGGGYFQATLSWAGNYSGNGGWPSFWADGQEAMASTTARGNFVEADIMEAWSKSDYSGTLHDWTNNGATNTQTSSGDITMDPSKSDSTYSMLWEPATASTHGSVSWFLNGQQVGQTVTWDQGEGPYSQMDAQHLALFLGTGSNPMTVTDVSVWQNPTTANNIGVTTGAAATCAVPPREQVPVSPPSQDMQAPFDVVTPGRGALAGPYGTAWMVTSDGQVMNGDIAVPGGGQTSDLAVINGEVWGKDNGQGPICAGCWFQLSGDQNWIPKPGQSPFAVATGPGPSSPTEPPTTPLELTTRYACSTATPNTSATSGGFGTVNGQILQPDGTPFVARGINIRSTDLADVTSGAVTATFPNLNFVRINIRSLDDPASLAPAVNYLTSRGIVAELEDHPNGGGGQGSIGAIQPQDVAWYGQVATYYKNNPYVWFGTYNEPPTDGSLSQWHKVTYDAIRQAGNTAPIMIEPGGSRPFNLTQPLDPSVYASMENIIMDPHVYAYQDDYSTDQATNAANVRGMISAAQSIKSLDGPVPVIIGEFGDSTQGDAPDQGGMQSVKAVLNSGVGYAAWNWNDYGGDVLRSGGQLTDYGQTVSTAVQSGPAPGCNISPDPLLIPTKEKAANPSMLTPTNSIADIQPPAWKR